jgi:hypothetical protein
MKIATEGIEFNSRSFLLKKGAGPNRDNCCELHVQCSAITRMIYSGLSEVFKVGSFCLFLLLISHKQCNPLRLKALAVSEVVRCTKC